MALYEKTKVGPRFNVFGITLWFIPSEERISVSVHKSHLLSHLAFWRQCWNVEYYQRSVRPPSFISRLSTSIT